jgi:hypothetical protein
MQPDKLNLKRDIISFDMETNPPPRRLPPFSSFLPFALLLFVVGWGGLIYLIVTTLPTLGPRWLFFFFVTLAMTGTGLPVIVFLNIRFPGNPPIDTPIVIRQACWVGIYGGIIVWLQLGRILTPSMGMLIAIGLVVIEGLLRLREKSRWMPTSESAQTVTIDEFHPPDDPGTRKEYLSQVNQDFQDDFHPPDDHAE